MIEFSISKQLWDFLLNGGNPTKIKINFISKDLEARHKVFMLILKICEGFGKDYCINNKTEGIEAEIY